MNAKRLAAAATAATGLFVLFMPAPERSLGKRNGEEIAVAKTPQTTPAVAAEALKPLFDLASLPQPPAPEPTRAAPMDPGAAIVRYALLGVMVNDDEAMALIADGDRQVMLKQGDRLAEFTVMRIHPRQVDFIREGVVASLRLTGTRRRASSDQ